MLPLIIVTSSQDKAEKYIDNLVRKYAVKPYYIFRILPEKKEVGIDQIRLIQKTILTNQKDIRLFIVWDFHTASIEAQNAFLKTLEERTTANLFVMIAQQANSILPTIISRAKIIKLNEPADADDQASILQKVIYTKNYSFLADKRFSALDFLQAKQILEKLLLELKAMRLTDNYPQAARRLLKSYQQLQNNNANPQLVVDNLLIYLHSSF